MSLTSLGFHGICWMNQPNPAQIEDANPKKLKTNKLHPPLKSIRDLSFVLWLQDAPAKPESSQSVGVSDDVLEIPP